MIWYLGTDPVQKSQECAVPLGIQGENSVLTYTADVSDWLALWPSGVVALVLQPPDHSDPYMANTAIDRDAGIVTWTITGYDTAMPGYGMGELRIVEGDAIKKSYRFATYVRPSVLVDAADPPEPVPDWINDLLEIASDIQGVVDAAEAARDAALAAQTAAESARDTAQDAQSLASIAANDAGASSDQALSFANQAEASAVAAAASADRAEQAAVTAGYMDFYIDEDGHLIYQRTETLEDVDFELENGRLIALWQ